MDETTQETFPSVAETQVFETTISETAPVETVPAETVTPETVPVDTYVEPETTSVTAPSMEPELPVLDYTFPDESIPDSTFYEVAEATETVGISEKLDIIDGDIQGLGEALNLIAGMLLFFTVVTLCYFVYKFFRIFF